MQSPKIQLFILLCWYGWKHCFQQNVFSRTYSMILGIYINSMSMCNNWYRKDIISSLKFSWMYQYPFRLLWNYICSVQQEYTNHTLDIHTHPPTYSHRHTHTHINIIEYNPPVFQLLHPLLQKYETRNYEFVLPEVQKAEK